MGRGFQAVHDVEIGRAPPTRHIRVGAAFASTATCAKSAADLHTSSGHAHGVHIPTVVSPAGAGSPDSSPPLCPDDAAVVADEFVNCRVVGLRVLAGNNCDRLVPVAPLDSHMIDRDRLPIGVERGAIARSHTSPVGLNPSPHLAAPTVLVGAALLSAHSGVTQAQSASERQRSK